MATPTKSTTSPSKSSQTSSDSFELSRQTANQKKTKFVVRKIPTFVTQDEIKKHLHEFIQKYNWFHFCSQPKIPNPTRRNKTNYNRFYINFVSFDDAIPFIDKFQKLIFKKPDPNQSKTEPKEDASVWAGYIKPKPNPTYKLCVEFAPNQSLPKQITSTDRRINTIEKDNDYLKFVQSLSDAKKMVENKAKIAEKECIRRNVMLVKKYSSKTDKTDKIEEVTEKKEEKEIAPLAQHVATKRHRRQLYKKINRASLVKSEKMKEKKVERIREMRRRKRIALAKAAKYGKRSWVARERRDWREREEYDEEYEYGGYGRGRYRGRYEYEYDGGYRGRKSGYGGRGRGSRMRSGYRGRGRRGYYGGDEPHFSGYSRRRGQQTWQKAK